MEETKGEAIHRGVGTEDLINKDNQQGLSAASLAFLHPLLESKAEPTLRDVGHRVLVDDVNHRILVQVDEGKDRVVDRVPVSGALSFHSKGLLQPRHGLMEARAEFHLKLRRVSAQVDDEPSGKRSRGERIVPLNDQLGCQPLVIVLEARRVRLLKEM